MRHPPIPISANIGCEHVRRSDIAKFCRVTFEEREMKSVFLMIIVFLASGFSQLKAENKYSHDDKSCQSSERLAMFGVDGRYEDYLRGCFPCCFCCGDDGDCCDECKDNNTLVAPQANNTDSKAVRTAFGKRAIKKAIKENKLRNVVYKNNAITPKEGYEFKILVVKLPDGKESKRFQLFDSEGNFSNVEVACSCDGFSSSGACGQIGSSPFGLICGGTCDGCEAFVLF